MLRFLPRPLAQDGALAGMDLATLYDTGASSDFLAEVRAFLAHALTPDMTARAARQAGLFADQELAREWQAILHARGWAAPAWPKEYGGTDWTPAQKLIFELECAAHGAPALPAMGLQMCGPVLIGHGTPEQKARFLPRMLSGEDYWCQGYSEPGAGSDLASLKTRAVRDGDDYVVSGQKIWTTHAHIANWIFLLVRTDPAATPQKGISFLLAPMDSPGITVRPIRSMSGEHDVNEVFFDNVRIPVANRVGAENDGWTVAKYLLEFERGGGAAAGRALRVLRGLYALLDASADQPDAPGRDPFFRRRLSALEIEIMATCWTQQRAVAGLATGESVGMTTAAVMKLKATELVQTASELAIEALGRMAMVDQSAALYGDAAAIGGDHALTPAARYMNMRAVSIFGGSSEMQRTILGKAILKR